MVMATKPTAPRGRPRKYQTESERSQARRVKIRQYVQAHRQRRKQKTISFEACYDSNQELTHYSTSDELTPTVISDYSLTHTQTDYDQRVTIPLRHREMLALDETHDSEDSKQTDTCSQHNTGAILPFCPSNPMEILSAARIDPFNTMHPEGVFDPSDHETLDHAVTYQWPVFRSATTAVAAMLVQSDVMKAAMSSSAAFYTMLFAGSAHQAYRHALAGQSMGERETSLRLVYKTRAMSALQKQIKVYQSQVVADRDLMENILLCIVTLAAHGGGEDITVRSAIPANEGLTRPLSFLLTAQDFHYYSALNCGESHWQALQYLVQQIGGLSDLKTAGLANAISLLDIFMATRTVSNPKFMALLSSKTPMLNVHKMLQTYSADRRMRTGFHGLLKPELCHDHSNMLSTLCNLRTITHAAKLYDTITSKPCRSSSDLDRRKAYLNDILLARNVVQHELVSLPNRDLSQTTNSATRRREAITFQLCRLTAVAYSDMVTYPVPGEIPMKKLLGRQIRQALRQWYLDHARVDDEPIFKHFTYWITIAYATYYRTNAEMIEAGTMLRTYLDSDLDLEGGSIYAMTYQEIKGLFQIESFLWADTTQDPAAESFWNNFVVNQTVADDAVMQKT